MLPLLVAFALPWMQQTQAPTHPAATHKTHSAAKKSSETEAPKGPKTEAELKTDLEANLHAAPLNGDDIHIALSGKDVTLTGEVHTAEHKGVATRDARKVAEKDGWTGVHVLNQIEVKLPGL